MNAKNLVEPFKGDTFPKKTYTFNVTKCDKTFDLLVKDDLMIVPPGAKIPHLKERKKRSFFKYHNFMGHKTSQCFSFRDLVQNKIKKGRIKFGDKSKTQMKIDIDPLQVVEAHYVEPSSSNMVAVMGNHAR